MKQIAFCTIYREYWNDLFFNEDACNIGENLLLPNILLRKRWRAMGYMCHTADICDRDQIKAYIFFDIPNSSIYTIRGIKSVLAYVVKRKWRNDYLLQARRHHIPCNLVVDEPPVIRPLSYMTKYYKYFDRVFTWNDDLVDGKKVMKFYMPQIYTKQDYHVQFEQKKLLTLIASNKSSSEKNELYSQRRNVIEYLESNAAGCFDFYGVGWENSGYHNYQGKIAEKIKTLSRYRFCICFENMEKINGYVTEKIFDCFFAQCVPVYWGAGNIQDILPKDTYIDYRDFGSIQSVMDYIQKMDINTYNAMLQNIRNYLNSSRFQETFDVNHYVSLLTEHCEVLS